MSSISTKLNYVLDSKSRLYQGMIANGYPVTNDMPLRDVVDLLYIKYVHDNMEEFDTSDLPTYWREEVEEALAYVLMNDGYIHHLVTTDNHYNYNYRESAPIIALLQETGEFGKIINLGDLWDSASELIQATVDADWRQFEGNFAWVLGNHDSYTQCKDYFDDIMAEDTDIVRENNSYSYYWDDEVNHIRYIACAYNDETFIASILPSTPSGYTVMMLVHYPTWGMVRTTNEDPIPKYTESATSIYGTRIVPYIVRRPDINFGGILCGHVHDDAHSVVGGVNQVALTNDGYSNDSAAFPKVQGTKDSQAITIVSINPTYKKVKFYRIGKQCCMGKQWQYSYDTAIVQNWLHGYFWASPTALKTETPNDRFYTYMKALPTKDKNNNRIVYYVYSTGQDALANVYYCYIGGTREDRENLPASSLWNNIVAVFSDSSTHLMLSLKGSAIESENVITTETPIINPLSDGFVDWKVGYVINNGGGESESENGACSSKWQSVKPNTSYRLFVDDPNFSATYMYAYLSNNAFQLTRRVGSSSSISEVVFTTSSSEFYVRFSCDNFKNNIDKIRIEEVT